MSTSYIENEVSIGIVSKNRPQVLIRLIERLKSHYPRVDLLVVIVEGNTEYYKNRLENNNTSIHYTDVNDLGLNRQWVVEKCQTKYLAFIDDDCVPEGNWLEELWEEIKTGQLQQGKLAGVNGSQRISSEVSWGNQNLQLVMNAFSFLGSAQSNSNIKNIEVDHLPTFNAIFDVEFVKQSGGFQSASRNVGEDLALGWRMRSNGFLMIKRSSPLVMHAPEGAWRTRVFNYGWAQPNAAWQSRTWPPMRLWLQVSFLPLQLVSVWVPLLSLIALCVLVFIRSVGRDEKRSIVGLLVLGGFSFIVACIYSLGCLFSVFSLPFRS